MFRQPKTTNMARSAQNQQKDPLSKVHAAIQGLRRGYKIGQSVRDACGDHADTGNRGIERAAKEHGRNADGIRKLRQFAAVYTECDLEELCDVCRRYQRAFGLSLLYKLVSIRDRKERKKFQREAIAEHWGHARIAREMRYRFKLGHKRGRKPTMPKTVKEGLVEVSEAIFRLEQLLQHCAKIAEQDKAKDGKNDKKRLLALSANLLHAIESAKKPSRSASQQRK